MKKFISILLSITFFITYFIFLANINFSNAFSKKSINKVVEDIEFTKKISSSQTSPENLEWDMMLNEMYEIAEDYDITKEEVNDIINSESTKVFILDYMEKNTDYIINSNSTSKIDINDIQNSIEAAINNYIENENTNLTVSQKEKISKFTSDNSYKIAKKLPTPELIEVQLSPQLTKFIKLFFNNTTRIVLIIAMVICLISIICLQRKDKKWILYIGTTILISNIFTLLFSLSINPIINFIIDYDANIIISLIRNFSKSIVTSYYIISSIGILLSIILLIIYKNIKRTT